MAFPTSPLDVKVHIDVGGWVDITGDVKVSGGISIRRGRSDESGSADPSECSFTLRDPTGKYSPRNPSSPYYGVLNRNTKVRVGIGTPPLTAHTAGQTGTSIVAPSLTATGAGLLISTWVANVVTNITPPVSHSAFPENDGDATTWAQGYQAIAAAGATGAATATAAASSTASLGASVFIPGGVFQTSSSVLTTDGGGGSLNTIPANAGDIFVAFMGWSSDPDDRMVAGPVDSSGSTRWARLHDTGPGAGPRLAVFMRRVVAAETLSFGMFGTYFPVTDASDAFLRVIRVSGAESWDQRFTGEMSALPPRWAADGVDVTVPVTASGVMRRLSQGDAPLRSPLYRRIINSTGVVAYWPLEDGEGSTEFMSAIPNAPAATIVGSPQFGADSNLTASGPLPTFTDAGLVGTVPTHTVSNNGYRFGGLFRIPSVGAGTGGPNLLRADIARGATIGATIVEYDGASTLKVKVMDDVDDGVAIALATFNTATPGFGDTFNLAGSEVFICVEQANEGPNLRTRLIVVRMVAGTDRGQMWIGSILTGSVQTTRVARLKVGVEGSGNTFLANAPTVGHVFVGSNLNGGFLASGGRTIDRESLMAFQGDSPSDRVTRLCQEERVPCYVAFVSDERMGPQRPLTFLDLIREAEDTAEGFLLEPRGDVGIALITSSQTITATDPKFTMTYGQVAPPFEPTDDDQQVRNDVNVTRIGGGSFRKELTVGRLSVQPPPNGVGRYDTSYERSLLFDVDAENHASWLLHLGTWDEARYPSVHVNLAAVPSLADAVGHLDVGDRFTITGLPVWLPPNEADLLCVGLDEHIGLIAEWDITPVCVPYGPYRTLVFDAAEFGRLDGETSTLSSSATTTATSMSVATPTGAPLWTTTAGDFPFDLNVGGERVTVTNITGASSPQTFTVTRSVNGVVKAHSAGAAVSLWAPNYLGL